MGHGLGKWYRFHNVKGHHTKDYYQLKKEIKRLIQESHLKKYVKGDFFQRPGKASSRGHNDVGSPMLRKRMELCKQDDNKTARYNINTLTREFLLRQRDQFFLGKICYPYINYI